MNEKIKELAEQAKDHADYYAMLSDEPEQEIFTEKFAHLIVRECLNVISKASKEADEKFTYMGEDVPTIVHQANIEKHFGVEE
jgi:hypothetical protein